MDNFIIGTTIRATTQKAKLAAALRGSDKAVFDRNMDYFEKCLKMFVCKSGYLQENSGKSLPTPGDFGVLPRPGIEPGTFR